MIELPGTPSDRLPDVLSHSDGGIGLAFLSLSRRDPDGRDAAYLEWHSLDHRPEQYRFSTLRCSLRLVSTPQCRAVRAASTDEFDAVDHVMTYLFSDDSQMPAFAALGGQLDAGGRMVYRPPSVGFLTAAPAGRIAAPRAAAGADVIPWRPATGVYLMIEEGAAAAAELVEVPGVAGVWWYEGIAAPAPFTVDARGRQVTYCYLDGDPVECGRLLNERMRERWASGAVRGLLAAPFHTIVPFDWGRYVP